MAKATRRFPGSPAARVSRRVLAGVLCLAGVLAMPVAAAAAAAPVASNVGAIVVTMPGDDALKALTPGATVTVKLKSTAKSRRLHRVAVITLERSGEAGSIAKATLAAGRFSAQIPPGVAGTYILHVQVGKRAFTEVTFEVTVDDPVSGPCGELPDDVSAELGVDSSRPQPGDKVSFSLANTGPGCLTTGYGFIWQVSRAGAWVDVPLNLVAATASVSLLPGTALSDTFTVPATTRPGRYRIVKIFRAAGAEEQIAIEVEVVAKPPV